MIGTSLPQQTSGTTNTVMTNDNVCDDEDIPPTPTGIIRPNTAIPLKSDSEETIESDTISGLLSDDSSDGPPDSGYSPSDSEVTDNGSVKRGRGKKCPVSSD